LPSLGLVWFSTGGCPLLIRASQLEGERPPPEAEAPYSKQLGAKAGRSAVINLRTNWLFSPPQTKTHAAAGPIDGPSNSQASSKEAVLRYQLLPRLQGEEIPGTLAGGLWSCS